MVFCSYSLCRFATDKRRRVWRLSFQYFLKYSLGDIGPSRHYTICLGCTMFGTHPCHFLEDISPFVGPLIPLFWTSGDVCPGSERQGGFPWLHASSLVSNGLLRLTSRVTPTNLLVADITSIGGISKFKQRIFLICQFGRHTGHRNYKQCAEIVFPSFAIWAIIFIVLSYVILLNSFKSA